MLDFAATRIQPLTERIFDEIIEAAGGMRAHPDHDRRKARGADYLLGNCVIELKILDDEGMSKQDRQEKLAALFLPLDPEKPVHVLDRHLLDAAGQRLYDRALEGPIKGAVKSAKGQLAQSRLEYPDATRSILMLVNNGNTALDHDEIVQLVSRRARNDTDDIDGVVVAGAYLHSDGFDTVALWPIDYVPIHLDGDFPEFDALREAFDGYAERGMTEAIINGLSKAMTKGPVLDTSFDLGGKTFVKPAPPLGRKSDFYINGRPRLNSTGIQQSPNVAVVFPELDRAEWERFCAFLPHEPGFGERYADWLSEREVALAQGSSVEPLVPVPVTLEGWLDTIGDEIPESAFGSVCSYATSVFHTRMGVVIDGARDIDKARVLPSRFILAVTEMIGQDEANDVSHILLVEQLAGFDPRTTVLVENARIFHLHACSLGAAYAVKHGVEVLRWQKDQTYAWA
ncbi:MAG: hypothetical protein ABI395_05535 [Sphingobium sp.]